MTQKIGRLIQNMVRHAPKSTFRPGQEAEKQGFAADFSSNLKEITTLRLSGLVVRQGDRLIVRKILASRMEMGSMGDMNYSLHGTLTDHVF